ncbi:hypothetical protein FPSE_04894 [Fusarium pseudograminearum CS3096]|uniref:Uncharacterized protein n=1 Tax=Fusarium pseudograminearum (strain CS3096) TaxID=1028729 RepID=K3VMJ0_FUSPC|nr:hypothetical protein FPSE_04894 [Fusarium pseudograminearum CS3096]EKJ74858.1 hypothetical protein FPSE_04894 [Fusarium pseudograminearum CS3096]
MSDQQQQQQRHQLWRQKQQKQQQQHATQKARPFEAPGLTDEHHRPQWLDCGGLMFLAMVLKIGPVPGAAWKL